MKVTYKNGLPVVPKGWRKLRQGEILRKGDMFTNSDTPTTWALTGYVGLKASYFPTYIRRKKGTK